MENSPTPEDRLTALETRATQIEGRQVRQEDRQGLIQDKFEVLNTAMKNLNTSSSVPPWLIKALVLAITAAVVGLIVDIITRLK